MTTEHLQKAREHMTEAQKWPINARGGYLEMAVSRILCHLEEAQTPAASTTPEPCSHPIGKLTPVKVEMILGKLCMVLTCSCSEGYFSLPWNWQEDD